jgi:hypothetical protein
MVLYSAGTVVVIRKKAFLTPLFEAKVLIFAQEGMSTDK